MKKLYFVLVMMFVAMALIGCQNKEEGNNDIQIVEVTQHEDQKDLQNDVTTTDYMWHYGSREEELAEMRLEWVESDIWEEEDIIDVLISKTVDRHFDQAIRINKYRFYHPEHGFITIGQAPAWYNWEYPDEDRAEEEELRILFEVKLTMWNNLKGSN